MFQRTHQQLFVRRRPLDYGRMTRRYNRLFVFFAKRNWCSSIPIMLYMLLLVSSLGFCRGVQNKEVHHNKNGNKLGGLYSILEDIHDIANNNTGKLCADRKGVRHFKVSFDVNQFLTIAETADFISDVTTARIRDEKYMDSKNIVSN